MKTDNTLAVLIISYRRSDGVRKLLDICKRNDISRIYLALDGPKNGSLVGKKVNFEIRQVIQDFTEKYPEVRVATLFRSKNLGCAASVLSACDWAFESEENLTILEDDCLPNDDFFTFSRCALEVMRTRKDIWLSCGTQFAPNPLSKDSWCLSRYALTWGWATTRENWIQISSALKSVDKRSSFSDRSFVERTYWLAGARRAFTGWVDVWDTILVQKMLANQKFSILPDSPLITNIGNDEEATHTRGASPWLYVHRGKFSDSGNTPVFAAEKDMWLFRAFFKISYRHLLSTLLTRVKDSFNKSRKPFCPLLHRWEEAEYLRSRF